mgnify:CR=1 FL=1
MQHLRSSEATAAPEVRKQPLRRAAMHACRRRQPLRKAGSTSGAHKKEDVVPHGPSWRSRATVLVAGTRGATVHDDRRGPRCQRKEDRRRSAEGAAGGRHQKEKHVAAYREAFGVMSMGCATATVAVSDLPELACSKLQPVTVPDVFMEQRDCSRRRVEEGAEAARYPLFLFVFICCVLILYVCFF